MSVQIPTCPTGCETELPEINMVVCDPDVDFGEIEKIYFTNVDNPLVDVTSAAEWASRLSNDSADTDAIRYLHVSAELVEPETPEFSISLCRKVYGNSDWTINLEIEETNDENYSWMMATKCNDTYLFWFESGKYIYGGNAGIEGQFNVNPTIPRGCNEIKKFIGTLKWNAKFPPERALNPMA